MLNNRGIGSDLLQTHGGLTAPIALDPSWRFGHHPRPLRRPLRPLPFSQQLFTYFDAVLAMRPNLGRPSCVDLSGHGSSTVFAGAFVSVRRAGAKAIAGISCCRGIDAAAQSRWMGSILGCRLTGPTCVANFGERASEPAESRLPSGRFSIEAWLISKNAKRLSPLAWAMATHPGSHCR